MPCGSKKKQKVLTPQINSPCVGQYNFDLDKIHKKITYNVHLRGKPKFTSVRAEKENIPVVVACKEGVKEVAVRPPSYHKEKRIRPARSRQEEEYSKFIESIDVGTVWKRLM